MNANRAAFRHVIRACEGTLGDEGYRALFGWRPGNGKVFASFADHPRQFFEYRQTDGSVVRTSAAGAYQATSTTWSDFIRERGPHDFTPASQDEFADWLIEKCGATGDVDAGRLRAAIDKCGGRWASLPSATVPQPRRTYQFCVDAFVAAGGVLAGTQPAAPIEDHSTTYQPEEPVADPISTVAGIASIFNPMAGGLIGLAGNLFKQFQPVLQAKLTKEIDRRVKDPSISGPAAATLIGDLSNMVLSQAKVLTGESDDFKAVAKAATTPEVLQKIEASVAATLDDLIKAGNAASTWDQAMWQAQNVGRQTVSSIAIEERKAGVYDMTRLLAWAAVLIASIGSALLTVSIVVQSMSWVFDPTAKGIDPVLLALAGPLLTLAYKGWGTILDYRFDGTKDSTAQSQALVSAAQRGGTQ